jgi:acyl-CoA synthetase (NDP forming)
LGVVKSVDWTRGSGKMFLTETESKKLLSSYGIPVVKETVVATEEEAAAQSELLGFPVVLKGHGSNLTHKTELGLVKLNLQSAGEVRRAFRDIKGSGGEDWEACLLQPMVQGRREFVAGLIRDAQFGPVVMFGLGGIFTEAIGDAAFRIAPLDEAKALDMMEELSSSTLLGDFRGEAAADREKLVQALIGLSNLGMERPDVQEVDINPLIVTADGTVTAVDALIVISNIRPDRYPLVRENLEEQQDKERTDELCAALDVMTHPKSIAVIGVTREQGDGFPGMFRCIRDFGFPGRLYPINPKADEIDGYKAYRSLVSLPEPADLVVISVPAPFVPDALRDCVASGSKNVHIFTSGFKETGEAEGARLHAEIEKIAIEGGLRIIGPNCMGFYVPSSRIMTWTSAATESGPVAFISQSGGNAQDFTWYASSKFGIYFSKVISYGNALTMDSTDFLEYLARDDETRIIAMYLEGVRDGRKLLKQVTEINRKKPVIIMKGGLTKSGARAVASHTGSMAGGEKIWQAFFRQTGAVQVDSLEAMTEVTRAFLSYEKCGGRGVAVIGTGGGIGVAAADSCSRVGLDLHRSSPELMKKLRTFIPPAGNMISNPIDAHLVLLDPAMLGRTLDLLSAESYLDMFVVSLHLDWLSSREEGALIEKIGTYIATEAGKHTGCKPLVVAWRQYRPNPETKKCRNRLVDILLKAGVPVYEGLPRALFALSKLAEYHEFQRRNK